MTKKESNPIGRISVPSIDDMADAVIRYLGLGTLDLANAAHRAKFRHFLISEMRRAIRWELQRPLEMATTKAIEHVLSLMEDPDYQETRKKRRKASRERMVERQAERDKKLRVDNQERRFKNTTGPIQ